VFEVLRARANTSLLGHKAVLYSTGPAVLREALRRLLRLPTAATISAAMLAALRAQLGLVVLDARLLHPITAERRNESKHNNTEDAERAQRPADAYCTHHFVSSWVRCALACGWVRDGRDADLAS
jgi:hypothetical protein